TQRSVARGRGIERVERGATRVEGTTQLLSARSGETGQPRAAVPMQSVGGRNPGGGIVLVAGAAFLLRLSQTQSTVRGQAGIADLVKQGAIADAQCAG